MEICVILWYKTNFIKKINKFIINLLIFLLTPAGNTLNWNIYGSFQHIKDISKTPDWYFNFLKLLKPILTRGLLPLLQDYLEGRHDSLPCQWHRWNKWGTQNKTNLETWLQGSRANKVARANIWTLPGLGLSASSPHCPLHCVFTVCAKASCLECFTAPPLPTNKDS